MCLVLENIGNYELEWIISPVTPAYIKVTTNDTAKRFHIRSSTSILHLQVLSVFA